MEPLSQLIQSFDQDRPVHRGDESAQKSLIAKGLIKIEVMDTGIGISKEGIKRLFHRYQQADSTISQYEAAKRG